MDRSLQKDVFTLLSESRRRRHSAYVRTIPQAQLLESQSSFPAMNRIAGIPPSGRAGYYLQGSVWWLTKVKSNYTHKECLVPNSAALAEDASQHFRSVPWLLASGFWWIKFGSGHRLNAWGCLALSQSCSSTWKLNEIAFLVYKDANICFSYSVRFTLP